MRKGEVPVSSKGHCNLSGVRTQDHSFYLGREEPDGTIILVPATLVPARVAAVPREGREIAEKVRRFPQDWKDELP